MNILVLKYNNINDTIELVFHDNEKFTSFLSMSVKQHERTWNSKVNRWAIIPEAIAKICIYAAHIFDYIDGTKLPGSYKMMIDHVISNIDSTEHYEITNPYFELHLMPTAPEFLVKAVYKILAKKYHPDGTNPDSEKFDAVKKSYLEIIKKP